MSTMHGTINIPIKVDRDFELSFGDMQTKYGEAFEYLNGFHETQLNFSDFIDGFVDKNVADVTIDANANASNKDIRSLMNEKGKSEDKIFAFNKIFFDMKKIYGLNTAKEWLENEWNGAFYLHDSSTTSYYPYCYAYDLGRLAREGLFFLKNYNAQAPEHLTTFIDDVIEYISFMCNRSSGAVGIPNILIWTYYFWKKDVADGYYLRNPEYYARQSFQKLIYRLNQPFMRIDQTAFVNVSIFDHNYLEALFGGLEYPDGTFAIDEIDGLIEHQKIFMEVVSEIRKENMFTFPVLTYSLLKRSDIGSEEEQEMLKTGNWNIFVDNEFARWCSDHNVTWNDSNFFMSDNVGTLSNCFNSKTRFITDKGVKSFGELNDGETINVVDMYGKWQQATVHYYGKQRMNKITLQSGRTVIDVFATDNHTWILRDGSRTTNLSVGHKLWLLPESESLDFHLDTLEKKRAFALGMILGDGSEIIYPGGKHGGVRIRLCGAKTKHADLFFELGFSISDVSNSHDILATYTGINAISKQEFLTNREWRYMSLDQKIALFNGYYAADGNKDRNSIATVDIRLLDMIRDISGLAGYYISTIRENLRDTNYKKNSLLYEVSFRKYQINTSVWTVKKIRRASNGDWQNCWCVDQPVNHSFTLENGIVTGNCCYQGSQLTLTRSANGVVLESFKDLYDSPYDYSNLEIFHDGKWEKGRIVRLPKRKMYRITTVNDKEVVVTDNHIFPTRTGDKAAGELTTDDELRFSLNPLSCDGECTYEQGYLVGLFVANGALSPDGIILTIPDEKARSAMSIIDAAIIKVDSQSMIKSSRNDNATTTITVRHNQVMSLIKRFASNGMSTVMFSEPAAFREGIIDGYVAAYGHPEEAERFIYAPTEELAHQLEYLLVSVGRISTVTTHQSRYAEDGLYSVDIDSPEEVIIDGNRYAYYRIKSIEPYASDDEYVYCFEMADVGNPYFTLPNGIVTHNCRLLSDTTKLDAFINSIGGTALSIGSIKVNTINLMRIALESGRDEDRFIDILKERTLLCCKALDVIRHIITRNIQKGLLPNYVEGAVDMAKQYSTVGM